LVHFEPELVHFEPELVHFEAEVNQFGSRVVCSGMNAELHTRRNVLTTGAAVAGVAVGAVALSACGSSADTGSKTTAPATTAPAGSSDSAQSGGQALAALADIPVGQAKSAKTPDGKDIVVVRPTATTAAAFSAICTHKGCTVVPAAAELKCPCHGSVFDALTGAVKKGPASTPLPSVAVKVANGQVVAG
jgi:Rieske Fe-S protein